MPKRGKRRLLHHKQSSSASAVGRLPSLSCPESTTPWRPSKTSSQERSPTSVMVTGSASAAMRQAEIPAGHNPQPCRSLPITLSWPKIPMRMDGARLDIEDSFPRKGSEGEGDNLGVRSSKRIVTEIIALASAKSKNLANVQTTGRVRHLN